MATSTARKDRPRRGVVLLAAAVAATRSLGRQDARPRGRRLVAAAIAPVVVLGSRPVLVMLNANVLARGRHHLGARRSRLRGDAPTWANFSTRCVRYIARLFFLRSPPLEPTARRRLPLRARPVRARRLAAASFAPGDGALRRTVGAAVVARGADEYEAGAPRTSTRHLPKIDHPTRGARNWARCRRACDNPFVERATTRRPRGPEGKTPGPSLFGGADRVGPRRGGANYLGRSRPEPPYRPGGPLLASRPGSILASAEAPRPEAVFGAPRRSEWSLRLFLA